MDTVIFLEPAITVFHLLIGIVLIVSVLLQPGKGAGLGAAFGVGTSDSLFGAQGSTSFLRKVTIVGATLFLMTSLSLALIAKNKIGAGTGAPSVVDTVPPVPAPAPQDGADAASPTPDAPTAPTPPASEPAP